MTRAKMAAALILILAWIFSGFILSAQAATYVYDDRNRVIEIHFDDETWITYTYDENGNRVGSTYHDERFLITATAGAGGMISPPSANVISGGSQTFTITPDTGHHITDVLVDGISQGVISSYTFSNVTAPHTIQAGFEIDTFSITASIDAGFGMITPASATVNYGGSQTFTISPDTGYRIADVKVDGSSIGIVESFIFNDVTANHTISASFAIITYSITTTVEGGFGGTISPSSATVNIGGNQDFTITPGPGFNIADVKVDGVSQGPIGNYTFTNVTANHTLSAGFNYANAPLKNTRTGAYYSRLQDAYDAAMDGDTILSRDVQLIENFTANRTIRVTVDGGYNADFTSKSGKTTVKGAPIINHGTVILKNYRITN